MKTELMIGMLVSGLMLGGCSSKFSFYQLHTTIPTSPSNHIKIGSHVIGIAEVEVAEYLDKPEMMIRLSEGSLQIHEEKRWAGSLPQNIQSVLVSELSTLLPHYTFMAAPWEEPISDRYRIYLKIDRFDGDLNGKVVLEGRWTLVDKESDQMIIGERIHDVAQGGVKTDETVSTQSRLIEKLSRHIASKLRRYL